MKKEIAFPDDPEELLKDQEVFGYLMDLEEKGKLDVLPLPFLVYYVIGFVTLGEVDNGGFGQYLSNSSVDTLPYLQRCADAIGDAELISLIGDLLKAVGKYVEPDDIEAVRDFEFPDEFEDVLSSLDHRFYGLDVDGLAKKYYRDHLPKGKLVIGEGI